MFSIGLREYETQTEFAPEHRQVAAPRETTGIQWREPGQREAAPVLPGPRGGHPTHAPAGRLRHVRGDLHGGGRPDPEGGQGEPEALPVHAGEPRGDD